MHRAAVAVVASGCGTAVLQRRTAVIGETRSRSRNVARNLLTSSSHATLPTRGICTRPALKAPAAQGETHTAEMASGVDEQRWVDVGELLASCAEAAAAGGAVIRAVQRAREAGGQGQLGASLKDADDPRSALTVADTAAQEAVMRVLRSRWPNVRIIGEEESEDEGAGAADSTAFAQAGRAAAMTPARSESTIQTPNELRRVSEEALCIFVDPLDGTREFVEGRLDAVQTLIGISLYGRSVAGAVGLPFLGEWGQEDAPVAVVRGIVGGGVVGLPPPRKEGGCADARGSVLAASAGKPKGVIADVVEAIDAAETIELGGVGNKVMALLSGDAEVAVMHLGTSLWDTCAPEALLRAAGGALTDLHGCRIEHSPVAPTVNAQGVLASAAAMVSRREISHGDLAARVRESHALAPLTDRFGLRSLDGETQATDVARDLDGQPLSVAALSAAVGVAVKSFDAPERSAVRAMMSEAVRLRLVSDAAECPRSLFYKRVVMGDLEHARVKAATAPIKLARDVKSYQVEAAFLGSAACAALVDAGVHVARPYAAQLRPVDASPIDSRFSLLLEDFASEEGWRQAPLLGALEMEATMETAAKMHAFFWTGSRARVDADMSAEVEAAVWGTGAYWQPAMQPAEQMDGIEAGWAAFVASFAGELPLLREAGVDVEGFGARLSAAAPKVARLVHEEGSAADNPFRTVVHGDLKSANVFLSGGEAGGAEAALIDFQWSGWGLGATDLAYLVASSAAADLLPLDGSGEPALLRSYHSHLCAALVTFGAAGSVESAAAMCPFPTLLSQYESAVVDVCRLAVAYQWRRLNASPEVLRRNASSLGRCAYNKSLHHAMWLVARTDAILRSRRM